MKTIIRGAQIITCDDRNTTICGDVVVQDNVIVFVGKKYSGEYDKLIDARGKILIPGFVNAHSHAAMSLFRNLGENTDFSNWWYDVMRPLEAKLVEQDYEIGIKLSLLEMIRGGIATFADMYMRSDITAKVAATIGERTVVCIGAITGKELLDEKSMQKQYNDVLSANPKAKIMCYAHSLISCDESQIAEVVRFAKNNNLVVTMHCSETMDEVGECYTKFGQTPVQYLESLGFFDNTKTLLAHCVHCDKDDVAILKNYDTAVVSNPSSNLILGSGVAPIYSFMKNGVPVCIGTDGPASNNSLNMFKEMFLLDNLQAGVLNKAKALKCMDTLKCATVNGAKALGYTNLGMIKVGYLADIVLIDSNAPNMQPANDNVCALVNSASVGNVYMTMVDGKVLYMDNKYTFDVDIDKLYADCNKAIKRIRGIANSK